MGGSCPPVPDTVAGALERYPAQVSERLMQARALIFAVAAETQGVGRLTETLKWGEPAYLTEASRSGSTIRLGATKSASDRGAVFFNCNTNLIGTFRTHFSDSLIFEGNRAILLSPTGDLSETPLLLCLRMALTYHSWKSR